MKFMRITLAAFLSVTWTITAALAVQPAPTGAAEKAAPKNPSTAQDLRWEQLIPDGYRPDEIFRRFSKRAGGLKDDDPRAQELQKELMTAWSEAPVVAALDGKQVKLPGYVIPLEGDGKKVKEFLLVPYFGACIHVPPPPSNQIVYVNADKAGARIHKMFDTVMVTGTMHTVGFATAVAAAGYTLEASKVEDY